jgi:hypothetical protein
MKSRRDAGKQRLTKSDDSAQDKSKKEYCKENKRDQKKSTATGKR